MEYTLYLFVLMLNFRCILLFNLDFRIPVVKRGLKDSYFGFSVAEHQSVDEITKETESWLLVGAPRGQNLQPNTNRSGALFRCPISTRTGDCEQVVTDGKRDLDGQYDPSVNDNALLGPADDELKDDQWMGVTVRSQGRGGKVLVCAHRYIKKRPDAHLGQGMCYTLTQYLDHDGIWEPCRGRPVAKAHEQCGYCQAGTSGALLADEDEVLVGTPGTYTWRGSLFVKNISNDFLLRDKTNYHSPLLEAGPGTLQADVAPVDKYSYLGMSVAGGRFFGGNETVYAAGAPRADGLGRVVLFSKRDKGNDTMEARLIVSGQQFASSFGYELAAADVDGDGRTDLAVGAPFFFSRDQGGAVYVYRHLCPASDACALKPQVLTGLPESRFGFALASLGDLNKDGFDDVAVGAPYQGNGAVYVFLGSTAGLLETPAQIVRAEELPIAAGPLHAFGYALSGGLDLDDNGYPDMVAGAWESDAVVLLRARPIVGITTSVHPVDSMRAIDHTRRGCMRSPRSQFACFTFRACCKLDPLVQGGGTGGEVMLNYMIEAETFESARKLSRVKFDGGESARPHVIVRNITVNTHDNMKHCQEHTVFIRDGISDIQSPIRFRLTYKLVQREPTPPREGGPLPSIDNFPILNQQEAAKTFEASFQKDCGDNDICESQLFLLANLILPNSRRVNSSELVLGRHHNVTLNVTALNLNESAYAAMLYVSHPRSLNYTHYKSKNSQLSCKPANTTLVACTLGNPFKRHSSNTFQVFFDPRDVRDNEAHFSIITFANSTSVELKPQAPLNLGIEVVRRAELSLTGLSVPDRLLYGGHVVGESAVHSQEQVGARVLHIYKLYNQGPWVARNVEVHVEWPHQVGNDKPLGKWLLYVSEQLRLDVEGGGECSPTEGIVNPLKLLPEAEVDNEAAFLPEESADGDTTTAPPLNRHRRDTEMIITPETYVDKDGRRHEIVNLSCVLGTAKCVLFRCRLYELPANKEALITITARLWNSTLVEDYPRVDAVHVWSRARLHLPPHSLLQQSTADDTAQTETVALPDRLDVLEPESAPLWIVAVAVVVGLLLLIALVLLLWKFGFFKRRRPDPTLSGNLEKHRDENGDYS